VYGLENSADPTTTFRPGVYSLLSFSPLSIWRNEGACDRFRLFNLEYQAHEAMCSAFEGSVRVVNQSFLSLSLSLFVYIYIYITDAVGPLDALHRLCGWYSDELISLPLTATRNYIYLCIRRLKVVWVKLVYRRRTSAYVLVRNPADSAASPPSLGCTDDCRLTPAAVSSRSVR